MKTKYIGEREEFAIEHDEEFYDEDLLRLRIWIDGFVIGTLDETTYLPSFLPRLKRFISCETDAHSELEFCEESPRPEDLFSLGESFDDFFIWKYSRNDLLNIKWKLVRQPFHMYADLCVGKIYNFNVKKSVVLAVHDELKCFYENAKATIWNGPSKL